MPSTMPAGNAANASRSSMSDLLEVYVHGDENAADEEQGHQRNSHQRLSRGLVH